MLVNLSESYAPRPRVTLIQKIIRHLSSNFLKTQPRHNETTIFSYFLLLLTCCPCGGQRTHIVIEQGSLVGSKVFPESSRTAVYAFLGVPYAEAPIGELRFALPKPHNGWNRTLQAMHMKPICPQLTNTIYDETPDGTSVGRAPVAMDEDCLFLNIWVPEVGLRFGNLPVLVIITGEEMSFDWVQNRPTGLDFASEGLVVITVQYRSNIFGWINVPGDAELSGNYGLHDQELALHWIQQNIQNFGGNPKQVTLLGHGTTGFTCVFAHMVSPSSGDLFSQIILMSGGGSYTKPPTPSPARTLIEKLGCHFEKGNQIVKCLRSKSVSDLLKAFESVYDHGNASMLLGPAVVELGSAEQALAANFRRPLIIGICSNEGAFAQDYWLEVARQGNTPLRAYINYTILPYILRRQSRLDVMPPTQVFDTLSWKYFGGSAKSGGHQAVSHLLNAMQRMISEALYETPFYRIIELLATANTSGSLEPPNLFAYVFQVANSMDMRGKINLFGGASHSSDLPFLLGPSLFQQIARRRFNTMEEKICRKMRTAFANFIKTGNPTAGRMFDYWPPYNADSKFILNIGDAALDPAISGPIEAMGTFEKNLPDIEELLQKNSRKSIEGSSSLSRTNRNELNSLGRRTKAAAAYARNPQDNNAYFIHLKDVYAFWNVLLPNMAAALSSSGAGAAINEVLSQKAKLMEASADANRYKQGFFLMLSLVCFLLAVLGICVYLLRRRGPTMTSRSSECSL